VTADFRDARGRLQRAQSNAEKLASEIVAWWADHPDHCGMSLEHYPQEGQRRSHIILKAVLSDQEPPAKWGLAVGDIVSDLRAVLDYIAYQAVIAFNGEDPPPNPRGIEFPIYKDEGRNRAIGAVHDAVADYVKAIQPYMAVNEGRDPELDGLWGLNELCNFH
jgi:hypothetical protein